MRSNGKLAGAVVVLALLGAVAGGCSSSSTSTSTTAGSTPTTASRRDAGTAPTLASLTSSVQAQITGTGPNDFNVSGLSKLTCDLPGAWTVGATFKCDGYDFANDEIGEYDGTVQSESGNMPQWGGQWSPK
jgi:hypothetical protein